MTIVLVIKNMRVVMSPPMIPALGLGLGTELFSKIIGPFDGMEPGKE